MTPTEVAEQLKSRFGIDSAIDGTVVTATVPTAQWSDVARFARETLGCLYFNWLSAVDWKADGFEVVARVENLQSDFALMLKTRPGAGVLQCPSVTGVWRGADWMERECYDMFGIRFDGHPDPRRILLPDDWDGYPLRKDYALDTPHPPYR